MCIDTLGTIFKWRNTSIFGKNKFKTGKSFRQPLPNVAAQKAALELQKVVQQLEKIQEQMVE